jgi:hypothetical protein
VDNRQFAEDIVWVLHKELGDCELAFLFEDSFGLLKDLPFVPEISVFLLQENNT